MEERTDMQCCFETKNNTEIPEVTCRTQYQHLK